MQQLNVAPPPVRSSPPAPRAAPALPVVEASPDAGAPNFGAAVGSGAGAALVGAAVWAAVTFATDLQIGWMAVGVGALVGVAVRRVGRGVEKRFAYAAAALALLGCLLGNLFATVAYISSFTHVPYFDVLGSLDAESTADLMKATFSPMDLLFYGIAMVEAYKLAVPSATVTAPTSP